MSPSPSPIVSQISTLEVSVSVTAGVTLTSLPAVSCPWGFEFCPPECRVTRGCHWRGVGAEQLCRQSSSKPAVVMQCALRPQLWTQFPSGCDGIELAVPLSGLWSSALHCTLCMGVVTKVRAVWQGDGESSSTHLHDTEQHLPPVETLVLQLWY